jgi:hypothetical protein
MRSLIVVASRQTTQNKIHDWMLNTTRPHGTKKSTVPLQLRRIICQVELGSNQRNVFWLAVLYIVVRQTLADSKAVLLAYYGSLRLFSCSYFTYILRSAVAQPYLLARRSRPLTSGLPRRRRGRG